VACNRKVERSILLKPTRKRATQQAREMSKRNVMDSERVKITRTSLKNLDQKTREEWGRHLHRMMKNRGMSQGELADKAFGRDADDKIVGRDRISKYLVGKSFPENATIALLCKAFDCLPEDLLPLSVMNAIETLNTKAFILEVFPTTGMCRVEFSGMYPHKIIVKLMAVLEEADKENR
jgi:transcriptional regulator with XRE-family HTH domain